MIVNRLAEEKVFDAGGACRSQRRNYYDGQASEQTPPTKGLLTKVEAAQDACGGGFVTQVQNSYDPTWHNLTRSQDGLGHGLTTVYDNEFHVFVSTQSNDLSQTTTTTYPPADVVQRALGLPSQTTDANNQVASYTYDGFGRPLTVNRPLGHASVDEQWVYTDYSSAASPRRVLHKLYDEVTTPANPERAIWLSGRSTMGWGGRCSGRASTSRMRTRASWSARAMTGRGGWSGRAWAMSMGERRGRIGR